MPDDGQQDGGLGSGRQLIRFIIGNWFNVITSLFTIAVFAVLIFAMAGNWPVIDRLANPDFARGLITFLICITTIGLGLLLVAEALFGSTDNQADERFRRGREVFTVLMGILGTIVGFYFGSAQQQVAPIQFGDVRVVHTATDKWLVTASIVGGLPPYRYTIAFDDKVIAKVERDTTSGLITEEIGSQREPLGTIEVEDKTNHKVSRRLQGSGGAPRPDDIKKTPQEATVAPTTLPPRSTTTSLPSTPDVRQ
jgi:hypothetical protein